MNELMRLPALPLVVNDPYLSIWCPCDRLTDGDTVHWSGANQKILGKMEIDGASYRFLGMGPETPMETKAQRVSPTATRGVLTAAGVEVILTFTTPLLPGEPDLLSTPATYVDITAQAADGKKHRVHVTFFVDSQLCYHGEARPKLMWDGYETNGLYVGYVGKACQTCLCHAGDQITIDWGYAYLAGGQPVLAGEDGLTAERAGEISPGSALDMRLMIGYDESVSVEYFGFPAKPWYGRSGQTLVGQMADLLIRREWVLKKCLEQDELVEREAERLGGDDYRLIAAAAYRQSIAAHKLIADDQGQMVFLSKENDSNGCIGTADLAYPAAPLFLKYNPELVTAMCRPLMRFALCAVWTSPFAPHDVGRYPYARGQVYGLKQPALDRQQGPFDVPPPYYTYPAGASPYDEAMQMPVEECGNLLILLEAARAWGAEINLLPKEWALVDQWAQYLIAHGEDPGSQMCTDDFTGHLAHNANLAAKAFVAIACYGRLKTFQGQGKKGAAYLRMARELAGKWEKRAAGKRASSLTLDHGEGWSLKYNLAWDKALGLQLLDDKFYAREMDFYCSMRQPFGVPLDSRASYTKSDWIMWIAALAGDKETFLSMIHPVAEFIRSTPDRVPFSDWYDTRTAKHIHFAARSVQGGAFMPMLSIKQEKAAEKRAVSNAP